MRASVTLVALALGATLIAPAAAHAQFGGIGKKITKKIGGNSDAPAAAAGGGAPVKPRHVAFDDRVLEVTPARLDRFLKGLAAEEQAFAKLKGQDLERIEKQNAATQAVYDKADREYQQKQEKYDACAEPIRQRTEKEMEAHSAKLDAQFNDADMQKLAARMQAAQQKGDMAEVRRLADSLSRASQAAGVKPTATAQGAPKEITAKCGPQPVAPVQPTYLPTMNASEVRQAGVKASGFNDSQYSIMRERVCAWVVSKGRNGSYAYAGGELAALDGGREALAGHEELCRSF